MGKIRVHIEPAPPKGAEGFEQKLCLKDASVYVRYGEALELKVWVDANHPVIHVASTSDKPVAMTASVELWRNQRHELPAIEVSDIYLDRSKPSGKYAETIVEPDTVLKNQRGRIGWYHHNSKSVGPELTMKIQDLADFEMTDPILHRTFGAIVTGEGAKRLNDMTLKTARAKSGCLDIYVLTEHPATPSRWLDAIESEIEHIRETPFAKRLAAHKKWWADFWDRSWIYATQNEKQTLSLLKPSDHPVRIGVDQTGHNRLAGSVARVSVFGKSLDEDAVRSFAKTDRKKAVTAKDGLLYSSTKVVTGSIAESAAWNFEEGLAVEAWIKPEELPNGGGRILDKITPGGDDGFLLDTYPGNSLRFITKAGTIVRQNVLPAGEWSHVAAVAGEDGLSLRIRSEDL